MRSAIIGGLPGRDSAGQSLRFSNGRYMVAVLPHQTLFACQPRQIEGFFGRAVEVFAQGFEKLFLKHLPVFFSAENGLYGKFEAFRMEAAVFLVDVLENDDSYAKCDCKENQ